MGEIEWAMWANEQAIVGAFLLLVGGIIGVAAKFRYWEFAAASIAIATLVLLFEWPRSKRKKGTTIERRFQHYLAVAVDKLGPIGKNYYVRFLAQIILSVPACFLLPTIMGGLCLIISAFIYLAAAVKGEEWSSTAAKPTTARREAPATEPPTHPPPRNPIRRDAEQMEAANRY